MSQLSLHSKQEHKAWVDEDSKAYVQAEVGDESSEISARRRWYGNEAHRKDLSLKNVEVGMEFSNGLLGESPVEPTDSRL